MSNALSGGGHDRRLLVFALLRRVGLGIGSYLAVFSYFNPNMNSDDARHIAQGVGLVAFCLPPVRGRYRPSPPQRGFEVVVPEQRRD